MQKQQGQKQQGQKVQQSQKAQQGQKAQSQQPLSVVPVIPAGIIYFIMAVWAYIALAAYFKELPVMPFSYTGIFANTDISLPAGKLMSHVYAILISLAIFIAAFGFGKLAVSKFFSTEKSDEKIVLFTGTGLGLLAILTFLAGSAGLLYKPLFIVLIAGLCIYGIMGMKSLNPQAPGQQQEKKKKFSALEICTLIVFCYAALVNLLGALSPETFYDAQFYLLGLVTKWKLNHKIAIDPFINQSYYPFNINMLYLNGLILNNEISAKLIHFGCGLFISYTVYVLCKKYFSRTAAVVAAVIFYTVPLSMMVSWKTAIELGIGVFETLMIFCFVSYMNDNNKKWLVFSGIMCGFALGSKYTSVLSFGSILATLLIWAVVKKENIKTIITVLLYFIVPAVVVSSPWYLRNIILTGNPLFPYLYGKIGHGVMRVTGDLMSDPARPAITFKNYALFLWPLTMGTLQQETFPGAVFLVFFPLLFAFRKIDIKIKIVMVYFLVSLVLWAYVGRFYLRYFIPTLPVISIIFAYYIAGEGTNKYFKNLMILMVLFLALSNINFGLRMLRVNQNPAGYVLGSQTEKEYLSTSRPSYPCPYFQVVDWANKNLPSDAGIMFVGETRGVYSQRRFYSHGPSDFVPVVEWTKAVKSGDELQALLKSKGVTHILLNIPELKRLAGFDVLYWDGSQVKIFNDFWVKYVKLLYKECGNVTLNNGKTGTSEPQFWNYYTSDPGNYVYLYEIMDEESAKKPHEIPQDFLLAKVVYSGSRYEQNRQAIESITGKQ